jgi:hypothetical protein
MKNLITIDSSQKLINFLNETGLHKKDLAEMIGVTLSYVYSLIDNALPFSTRNTTLERIAVVMDIKPEELAEYKPSEEPKIIDDGIDFLIKRQRALKMTTVQVLKKLPRSKRVEVVDLYRGAKAFPLDWNLLSTISGILKLEHKEIFPFWKNRLQRYLISGGLDMNTNSELISSIIEGAKKYLKV